MKYFVEITRKDGSTDKQTLSMKALHDAERKRKSVKVVGEICEQHTFGDMCGMWCYHYRHGRCRAKVLKDSEGRRWHVWSNTPQ